MIFSRLLVSALMLGFVFLSACSEDETVSSTSAGTMTSNVNGANYDGSYAALATSQSGLLTLQGKDNSNQTILLSLVNITKPGVYPLGTTSMSLHSAQYIDATGTIWNASQTIGSGSIAITTLTSTDVSGTFSFVGEIVSGAAGSGTRTVTNGKFSMKITP